MRKKAFLLSVALSGGLAVDGCRAAALPAREVPFELHGHFIVVKGSVGNLEDLNLVIDTGASATTLSPRVAGRLGLKGKTRRVFAYSTSVQVETVRIPPLRLGAVEFEPTDGWVGRLSFPDMSRSLRIDALVGLDLLRGGGLTIDYESGVLRFGPVGHGPNPVAFYGGLPFVPVSVRVRGEHLRLLLDTAAPDLILFTAMTAGRLKVETTGERKRIRSEGGTAVLRRVRLNDLSLGGVSWDSVAAFVLDGPKPRLGVDGVLGPMALGCKRLHLDFDNNLLSWE